MTASSLSLRVLLLCASLTAAALVATGAPAAGSVTIGQLAPGSPPTSALCGGSSNDFLQPTVTSGTPYVVPALPPAGALTITSWSTNASADAGQRWAMKIFRPIAGSTYVVVGHDSRVLNPGALNTFATNVPVRPGDVLGLNENDGTSAAATACDFSVPGESYPFRTGNLADGESGAFDGLQLNFRLNITAVVAPTNAFTIGELKRNKRKGTATLTVNVSNPGELVLAGRGVKRAGAAGAMSAKAVTAPGDVNLRIRAKGKQNRKLSRTGTVKLRPRITFTPTGGDPSTQSLKLRLKKR